MTEKPATPAEIAREFAANCPWDCTHRDEHHIEVYTSEAEQVEWLEPRLTRWLDSHLAEERAARKRAEAALLAIENIDGRMEKLTDSGLLHLARQIARVYRFNAHPSGPERAGTGEKIGR